MKTAILRAAIVLVPSWSVAWITDKMVWVVPAVVASALVAASIQRGGHATRVDDGAAESAEGISDTSGNLGS